MRDAMIEKWARGLCVLDNTDPDEIMPDKMPRWHDRAAHLKDVLSVLEATGATVGVWQDIASAPRDGTEIDIWGTEDPKFDSGPSRFTDARWCDTRKAFVYWDALAEYGDGDFIVIEAPTHWLPRPAAPLAASPMREEG